MTAKTATPVLFVDLDDTVRHGVGTVGRFVNTPDDVVVFPEALQAIRQWDASGGRIVAVTNQGGLALGLVTPEDMHACLARTMELVEHLIDVIAMCPHHPSAADPELASCWCRKPSPGPIFDAVAHLRRKDYPEFYPPELALMVGDRPEDQECARRAGIAFKWADEWREAAGHVTAGGSPVPAAMSPCPPPHPPRPPRRFPPQ